MRYSGRAGDRSATPLLIFNGLGANIELASLSSTRSTAREIVMFDVPGVGGSPAPRRALPALRHRASRRELLDHLGHDGADVLGVSWGGAIAQQFALRHPARCRRLVLAATAPGAS